MAVDQTINLDNLNTVRPERRRLPDERRAITHHFSVGGQEGYVTVGFYADGQPGELFIKMAKQGSTVSGLMMHLRRQYRWLFSTASRFACCATCSVTCVSSRAAGPAPHASATRSH